jgi:hypothetical protein
LADKEKFLKEIENLENALDKKLYSKKLVETRCEERLYRIGAELCLDKTTIELHKEQLELDNTIQILTNKLNQTKYDKNEIFRAGFRKMSYLPKKLNYSQLQNKTIFFLAMNKSNQKGVSKRTQD